MSNAALIKRVRLKNVLSHENSELTFQPGLTAIVGPNGAGKSSIVDSMVYALFTTPAQAKGLRGESKRGLLRLGSSEGVIEVEFTAGGKDYVVERHVSTTRQDSSTLIEIVEGGRRIIATGVHNVLDRVKELLGIPSAEVVRYTTIARQNELMAILDLQPSERKELILRLLGFEELEKARELLRDRMVEIVRAKGECERAAKMLSEERQRLTALAAKLGEMERRRAELAERVSNVESEVGALQEAVRLCNRYREVRELIGVAKELRALESMEGLLKRMAELNVEEIIGLLESKKSFAQGLEEALRGLEAVTRRFRELRAAVSRILGEDLGGLGVEELLKVVEEKLKSIEWELAAKEAELAINEGSAKIVERFRECPVCGRPLDDELKRKVLGSSKSAIELIKRRKAELVKLHEELSLALREIRGVRDKSKELESRINTLRERSEQIQASYEKLEKDLLAIINEVRGHELFRSCFEGGRENNDLVGTAKCLKRKALEALSRVTEYRRLLESIGGGALKLEGLLAELESLASAAKSLGLAAEDVSCAELERRYKVLQSELVKLVGAVKEVEGKLAEMLEQKRELEARVRELEREAAELEKLNTVHRALDILANKILGKDGILAKTLTAEVRRLVERYANAILQELGFDFTISIGDDFRITVRSGLGELDVRGLSGGESVGLAIALRMALAYAILGRIPSFFILDEPTLFLDSERRRGVFDVIRRLADRMPQVIVITHDPDVVELADRVYVVNKEGGKSVIREGATSLKHVAE